MNKGTPADPLREAKRLVRAAIDAHRPLFNGEMRLSSFQERDAEEAVKKAYAAIAALATEPAETPASVPFAMPGEDFAAFVARGVKAMEGHPTESAGKSPEAADGERFQAVMERLESWSKAYPLDVFPKPDYKRTAEVLGAAGLTLDRISADCMRHVITKVWEMLQPFAETQRSSNATRSDEQTSPPVQPPAPEPPDRNMEGAREFVNAIMSGAPIWPNPWGQDVACAAYFIHRERTDPSIAQRGAPEPNNLRDAVLGLLRRWEKDDDYDLDTCIRNLRDVLAQRGAALTDERAAALEEAAKACEAMDDKYEQPRPRDCAAAIRALSPERPEPPAPSTTGEKP